MRSIGHTSTFVAGGLFLAFFFLFVSMGFPGERSLAQEANQQRPVWDVQLASNARATSNITILNQCKQTHTFTVTEKKTPYIQLLASARVSVPGSSSYDLPVRFNTDGMNAGVYQGTVLVKCETCRKERQCLQDREVLPVRLTILQGGTTPTTPQNPMGPQLAGPPVIGAPPGGAVNVTASVKVPGYDPETKKKVADIEFSEDISKPCAKQKCGEIKTVEKGEHKGDIYCQEINNCGGKDCPEAGCHMLVAWKDKKDEKIPKGFKDPEKWRSLLYGVGENKAIKPEAGKIYGCGCY